MFSAFQNLFGKNKNETNSVRSPDDIDAFNSLVKKGPKMLVLIHADWCGPCQNYKPTWKELESTPGRIANMAMVHHDMVENIDLLKKANIPGYPSVLKLFPDGRIEEYKDNSKKSTNSLPHMRDVGSMVTELRTLSPAEKKSAVIKPIANINMKIASKNRNNLRETRRKISKQTPPVSLRQMMSVASPIIQPQMTPSLTPRQMTLSVTPRQMIPVTPAPRKMPVFQQTPGRTPLNSVRLNPAMKGGLYSALTSALMKAAPASFLFGASQMLPPKKNRGSTKRLTRKSRSRR